LGLMYGRTQQKREKSPVRDNCGLTHKAFTDTKKDPYIGHKCTNKPRSCFQASSYR
jgi:hypothetical protein